MGRKPIPGELRKINITVRLPKWMVDDLKKQENYTKFIEDLIRENLEIFKKGLD